MSIETDNRLNDGGRHVLFNQFEYEQNRLNESAAADGISQFAEQPRADFEARKSSDLDEANSRPANTTKLSRLQKQILALALKWRGKSHCDVYHVDVKAEIFDWPVMHHYWSGWEAETSAVPGTARYASCHHIPDEPIFGQIFNRSSIGVRKYNAVSVSVTRTLQRLTERNLLFQTGRGWSLTAHGLKVAKTAPRAVEY